MGGVILNIRIQYVVESRLLSVFFNLRYYVNHEGIATQKYSLWI